MVKLDSVHKAKPQHFSSGEALDRTMLCGEQQGTVRAAHVQSLFNMSVVLGWTSAKLKSRPVCIILHFPKNTNRRSVY